MKDLTLLMASSISFLIAMFFSVIERVAYFPYVGLLTSLGIFLVYVIAKSPDQSGVSRKSFVGLLGCHKDTKFVVPDFFDNEDAHYRRTYVITEKFFFNRPEIGSDLTPLRCKRCGSELEIWINSHKTSKTEFVVLSSVFAAVFFGGWFLYHHFIIVPDSRPNWVVPVGFLGALVAGWMVPGYLKLSDEIINSAVTFRGEPNGHVWFSPDE